MSLVFSPENNSTVLLKIHNFTGLNLHLQAELERVGVITESLKDELQVLRPFHLLSSAYVCIIHVCEICCYKPKAKEHE